MQKMAVKIIHNLNADVKDISIRIVESSFSNDSKIENELSSGVLF
jgi:hypothetical protein